MIETEREKLMHGTGQFISVGIAAGGVPVETISVPWESTSYAMNMKTPGVFISPDDLKDEGVMAEIRRYAVLGCYIFCPLEDYSFLAEFSEIWDIYILHGDKITNLDFLSTLYQCRMLFLQNAKLKNLDVILDVKKADKTPLSSAMRCVGLYNCKVDDISALEKDDYFMFSEFLVWNPKNRNERHRWSKVKAGTRKYYEIDSPMA